MALIKAAYHTKTQIRNTHASGDAGAVYVKQSGSFENVVIIGCSAGGNGGAVVTDNVGTQLVATTIEGYGRVRFLLLADIACYCFSFLSPPPSNRCTAGERGGGIFVLAANFDFDEQSTISNCRAKVHHHPCGRLCGGAAYGVWLFWAGAPVRCSSQ